MGSLTTAVVRRKKAVQKGKFWQDIMRYFRLFLKKMCVAIGIKRNVRLLWILKNDLVNRGPLLS